MMAQTGSEDIFWAFREMKKKTRIYPCLFRKRKEPNVVIVFEVVVVERMEMRAGGAS